jgi:O-antigen/teichoic acid export membrane protein
VIRAWSNSLPDSRRRRIFKAVSSGSAAKLLTGGVSFLTLPLAVRYLGAEKYGVWATITTTAVWINLLDLGVANTLTNEISRAYALKDKEAARRYFTNSLVLTVAVASLVGVLFTGLMRYINWGEAFNIGPNVSASEVGRTVVAAVCLTLLGLPCNLVSKLLAGYQELHRHSVASAGGAIASLIGLALGITLHVSMPTLYVMSLGCVSCASLVVMLVVLWQKPWLLPRPSALELHSMRRVLDSGSSFFLIQVAAVVVFSSDNLIVSHYLGAAEVTPYSVTWRLAGLAALAQSLIFPALWPAYAEAYAKRDFQWVRRTFAMTLKGIVVLNVVCATGLVLFGRVVIRLWAGPAAVPGTYLLVAMAVWIVVNGFMSVESCLLAAVNRTRAQALLSIGAAGLNIVLSVLLVRHIGATGVIGGTVLSYLVVLVVPQTLIVRSVWRRELHVPCETTYPIRNGLLPRSMPIVVDGPCPGTTTVSSGNASTGPRSERIIFS